MTRFGRSIGEAGIAETARLERSLVGRREKQLSLASESSTKDREQKHTHTETELVGTATQSFTL